MKVVQELKEHSSYLDSPAPKEATTSLSDLLQAFGQDLHMDRGSKRERESLSFQSASPATLSHANLLAFCSTFTTTTTTSMASLQACLSLTFSLSNKPSVGRNKGKVQDAHRISTASSHFRRAAHPVTICSMSSSSSSNSSSRVVGNHLFVQCAITFPKLWIPLPAALKLKW